MAYICCVTGSECDACGYCRLKGGGENDIE